MRKCSFGVPVLLTVLLTVLLAIHIPNAAADCTIRQPNYITHTFAGVYDGLGQSFTACQTGFVRSISFYVNTVPTDPISVGLQAGTNIIPQGSPQSASVVHGFNTVILTTPLRVTQGMIYSFGLVPTGGYFSLGTYNDPYPGGMEQRFDGSSNAASDLTFMVEIVEDPTRWITRTALYQDSFPASGSIDASTMASRDALDIPLNAAHDTNPGPGIVPEDNLVGVVFSTDPIGPVVLHYSLNMNPLFEAPLRTLPAYPEVIDSRIELHQTDSWDQMEGEIRGTVSAIPGGFEFEVYLPDVDFMYPGDVLEYYIEVDGQTFPQDLTGFDDLEHDFDYEFVVRGLPTILDPAGAQPNILWVNANGHGDHETEYRLAMGMNSERLGLTYDLYTVNSPASGEPNGIGSAGAYGATVNQIVGYEKIIYTTGCGNAFLLNDGSGIGSHTESDEISLLRTWQDLPGTRKMCLFGANLASVLSTSTAGTTFLNNQLGVTFLSADVSPKIGGASTPVILGRLSQFSGQAFAIGYGCSLFDEIDIFTSGKGNAAVGHNYKGYPTVAASVVTDWNGDARENDTFPFALDSLGSVLLKGDTRTSMAVFLEGLLSGDPPSGPPVSSPEVLARSLTHVVASPNPFNPDTGVSFNLAETSDVSMRIYTMLGELVREYPARSFTAGRNVIRWQGDDGSGRSVASGVYIAELVSGRETCTAKLVLMK